eukprot:6202283-Pleurochrysis_carterae.AAC.1
MLWFSIVTLAPRCPPAGWLAQQALAAIVSPWRRERPGAALSANARHVHLPDAKAEGMRAHFSQSHIITLNSYLLLCSMIPDMLIFMDDMHSARVGTLSLQLELCVPSSPHLLKASLATGVTHANFASTHWWCDPCFAGKLTFSFKYR